MTTHVATQSNGVTAMALTAAQGLGAWLASEAVRHAVRVALAMVIVYFVSLSMGWERPGWAGLAVALCSLATAGESLNKGLLRILGTCLAGAMALLLIALFPQERWPYLLSATAFIAFCTYMIGGTSRWYFWYIGGYVMALLALAGGPEGATAFETVVLRIQQTTLGVVVYTLVAVLLWPRPSAPVLTQLASSLVDVQRRLLGHYFAVLAGTPESGEVPKLRAQASAAEARLPAIVDGAELDSFEVWEARQLWRRFAGDVAALNEALERWRQGFPELEDIDSGRLMPGLQSFGAELDARLASVTHMLAGEPPQRRPEGGVPELAVEALESLRRFDRAALVRSHDLLREIDRLTRALFGTVADTRGFGSSPKVKRPTAKSALARTIDPDRLALALRSFTSVWIILVACMYVPGFPMPAGVIPTAAAIGIMIAVTPEVPVRGLVLPCLASVAFAGAFHIFVMPQLSGFVGLGTAIFIAIFLVSVLLAKPQQAVARTLGVSLFPMIINVSDEQTYSFLFIVEFGLMMQLALLAVWISTWFPISFEPDRVVFKQLRRYLSSCDRVTVPLHLEAGHPLGRMRHALDLHEVATLPGKIRRWFAALPATAYGNGTPEQATYLVDGLQVLAGRMSELVEVRGAPQSAALVQELTPDMHAWRLAIQEVVRGLAAEPENVEATTLRARLDAKLEALEARIEGVMNGAPEGAVSAEESGNMYRLLGAYRGVSEALVALARLAAPIDWRRLREARF